MDLNKLTKKELVEHGKSLGLSLDIKAKKEVLIAVINDPEGNAEYLKHNHKTTKDPWWAVLVVFVILIVVAKYWFLPILIQYHLGILVVACLVASWLIEIKLTSDMKYTGGFSIIFVLFFIFSGAIEWHWEPYYLI
jgi:hypothetical protein